MSDPPTKRPRSRSPPARPRTGRKAVIISPVLAEPPPKRVVGRSSGVLSTRRPPLAGAPPRAAPAGPIAPPSTARAATLRPPAPSLRRPPPSLQPRRSPPPAAGGGRGAAASTARGPSAQRTATTADALHDAALDGRLWYAACGAACAAAGGGRGATPPPLPIEFGSGDAYVALHRPLLHEEARQCVRAGWAEAATSSRSLWRVDVVAVVDGARGRVVATAGFPHNAPRPPPGALHDGDVVVLTRGRPPVDDAADWAAGGRGAAADGGVELEEGEVPGGGDGAAGAHAPPSTPPTPFAGVLRVRGDSVTVTGRPVCPGHEGRAADATAPCASALATLCAGASDWWLTVAGPLTTSVRELAALDAVPGLPLAGALLSPSAAAARAVRPGSAAARRWPPEVGAPDFVAHLQATFDHAQLRAIEVAACHLSGGAGLGAPRSTSLYEPPRVPPPPFTLIQGPPGTGKTHTVVGVLNVWHLVAYQRHYAARAAALGAGKGARGGAATATPLPTHTARRPRLLVTAPSNAAVDELLRRVTERGFVDGGGSTYRPSVVRVGSDAAPLAPAARAVWVDVLVAELLAQSPGDRAASLASARAKAGDAARRVAAVRRTLASALGTDGEAAALNAFMAADDARERAELTVSRLETAATADRGGAAARRAARDTLEASFIDTAEMVFTTLSSTGRKLFDRARGAAAFDTVLIDEAAQATEVAALQALALGARAAVLVGDPRQLPATVLTGVARAGGLARSLFERLVDGGVPAALLAVQYRMHPSIRAFPSSAYYGGALEDAPSVLARAPPPFYASPLLKPYTLFDVSRARERRAAGRGGPSLANDAEAVLAAALYAELRRTLIEAAAAATVAGLPPPRPVTVGVLTPYRAQVAAVTAALNAAVGPRAAAGVRVATVDAFQGSEVDVAILTTVRARGHAHASLNHGGVGFLDDARRLNVAVTRARQALWIVGCAATLGGSPAWRALLQDARARGVVIQDADARSLFPGHRPWREEDGGGRGAEVTAAPVLSPRSRGVLF